MTIVMGSGLAQHQKNNQDVLQIKQSQAMEERIAITNVKAEKENDISNGDKLSLSREGLQKLTEEVNGTDEKVNNSAVDLVIAKLIEQIEHVQEQLKALEGNDSPEAEERRVTLNGQLSVLNSALQSAIEKKLRDKQDNLSSLRT